MKLQVQLVPLKVLRHRWLSVPCTKTSSEFAALEVTAGSEASMPPRELHPDQPAAVVNESHQSAVSFARAKRSIRPTPHETAAGRVAGNGPPRSSQVHVPLKYRCQMCASVPRTNASSRFVPQVEAMGPIDRMPPWD